MQSFCVIVPGGILPLQSKSRFRLPVHPDTPTRDGTNHSGPPNSALHNAEDVLGLTASIAFPTILNHCRDGSPPDNVAKPIQYCSN